MKIYRAGLYPYGRSQHPRPLMLRALVIVRILCRHTGRHSWDFDHQVCDHVIARGAA